MNKSPDQHRTSIPHPLEAHMNIRKLNTVVVEDDPVHAQLLRHLIQHTPELGPVEFCSTAEEALGTLSTREVDLLLLDVGLPGASGFELLDQLSSPPQVIITTADGNHAIEGFERGVVDLLVKPFTLERLLRSIHRAKARSMAGSVQLPVAPPVQGTAALLNLRSGRRTVRISASTVLMAEALGNHVKLHLKDRIMVVNCTMKKMESELPKDRFVRVHRSYIIAIDSALAVVSNVVFTALGEVPLGAMYRKDLRERMAELQHRQTPQP
jgi:DNA-binding LytR/AlgR family response regulator